MVTTNLNYRDPELLRRPYYLEADMTAFLATIIEHLNHDVTLSKVETPTHKINKLLKTMRNQ